MRIQGTCYSMTQNVLQSSLIGWWQKQGWDRGEVKVDAGVSHTTGTPWENACSGQGFKNAGCFTPFHPLTRVTTSNLCSDMICEPCYRMLVVVGCFFKHRRGTVYWGLLGKYHRKVWKWDGFPAHLSFISMRLELRKQVAGNGKLGPC